MSDHGLLLRILKDSTQRWNGPFVLHLSQTEGQFMFQQSRVILEGLADPVYGISTWQDAASVSSHTPAQS